MGAAVAPSFANLFVHRLEKVFFLSDEYKDNIVLYQRYVDDILIIWKGQVSLFQEMVNKANLMHSTIKFTSEVSNLSINFLDVKITKTGEGLSTELFRKPTDRNSLLHSSSFHNPKCIAAIPKGQFLRARRIASDDFKYWDAANSLSKRFKEKGYNPRKLNEIARDVSFIPRDQLLSTKITQKLDNKKNERIPFVSKYSNQSDQIEKVIKRFWPILQQDKILKHHCSNPPLFSYKRGQTLRDKLCPSELRKDPNPTSWLLRSWKKGTFPCMGCVCCSSVTKGDTVYHPITGKKYKLYSYATCDTAGVVYLLKCPCGMVYVGQTSRQVKERIKEHKADIRNFKPNTQTDTSVSHHFHDKVHNQAQLKWQVLEVVRRPERGGSLTKVLLQQEARWIKKLNSLKPEGLNDYWSVSSFL
ncbi:uncharacterized protein LOC121403153 [Xenopus laevis]|uniref:Uncharacterized protein LOC121403153 n=1 Tax=Xenopus laevis TaxID=8355 RepID=A0A8J1MZR7_XENLA|nr:uncharacterized protein LOC121403153 [Xenopus laevis]